MQTQMQTLSLNSGTLMTPHPDRDDHDVVRVRFVKARS